MDGLLMAVLLDFGGNQEARNVDVVFTLQLPFDIHIDLGVSLEDGHDGTVGVLVALLQGAGEAGSLAGVGVG